VTNPDYEYKIFAPYTIHRIEVYMEDWEGFLETAVEGDFVNCTVVIDHERFENVAICCTENSYLTEVREMGSSRCSLTLEFDRYNAQQYYYGLDKLSLNNMIHDNTMMKDYLTYQVMNRLGAPAPLCSYTRVYVNGKALGLYLAVEAIEDSFLTRNYGSDHGELYMPYSDGTAGDSDTLPDEALHYIDDDPDSYPDIFGNAKTDVTEEDQARLIQSLKQLSTGKNLNKVVDAESVTRYFAYHNFVCNDDSYTGPTVRNYFLYEKDGQLSILPWGYNLAFGGMAKGDAAAAVNASIYAPVAGCDVEDRPMLSWILENDDYTWLYKRFLLEIISEDIEPMIDQTKQLITSHVIRDPSRFCTVEEYEAGVEALKQFLELRAESVQLQTSGKPANVDPGDLNFSAMGGLKSERNDP
jgi:spore coat protein CotH